jgi:hypothetical protein
MDTPKPAHPPVQLLNDLESIRELLGEQGDEPPLLLDSLDPASIPLLSDLVTPAPAATVAAEPSPTTLTESLRSTVQRSISRDSELNRLDTELRAAAQLILQDVIDDFVPQIEAELKRRLDARLSRLLPPRKP